MRFIRVRDQPEIEEPEIPRCKRGTDFSKPWQCAQHRIEGPTVQFMARQDTDAYQSQAVPLIEQDQPREGGELFEEARDPGLG